MPQVTTAQNIGYQMIEAAMQMEELGRDFYEALAGATSDAEVANLCRRLAAEEKDHQRTFARIRSELAEQGLSVLLRDDQWAEGRKAVKDMILPDQEAIYKVARKGSVGDALALAIQMEQDAIRFYTGMAGGLPQVDAVNAVIAEERHHLRVLSEIRDGRRAPG